MERINIYYHLKEDVQHKHTQKKKNKYVSYRHIHLRIAIGKNHAKVQYTWVILITGTLSSQDANFSTFIFLKSFHSVVAGQICIIQAHV